MIEDEMRRRMVERNAKIERLQLERRIAALRKEDAEQQYSEVPRRRHRLGDLRHIFGLR